MDKNVLRQLSYGVYVVTSLDGDRSVGCVANSAMQVSSKPATLAVSINHDNYTNGAIAKSGRFVLAILPEDVDPGVIGTFGFSSSRDTDKFASVEWIDAGGIRTVAGCIGYALCRVVDTMESSTHTVFLGEVENAVMVGEGEPRPMTYAYYHNVKKGKSPKNAPTYVEEEATFGKKRFVCSVCGYVYEGDELPADFKCPVCGVGADKFKEG